MMMQDRKAPQAGINENEGIDQTVDRSAALANDDAEPATDGAVTRDAADRKIEALLRIIGLQDGGDRELTGEEADLIFELADGQSVSDEQLRRIREGVLRRRFGTTPIPDQGVVKGLSSVESSAVEAKSASAEAVSGPATVRPSLIRRCTTIKRKLADVAAELRLDRQTLFELDRGGARSVPRALIEQGARTLKLERDEVARCLAPGDQAVMQMAAHGRRGAQVSKLVALREFLDVIDASKLSEADKKYWNDVVAAETAANHHASE